MATYTVTTPVNIDTLTSKAGADTYNINGASASVTFDQHTRYGLNSNTSAALGTINPSTTLGGSTYFDARYSRLVYYTGGSGNVPADGTTISKGSASGVLVAVYSALNAAPTAAGAAMPATGYILLKQWNSVSFTSGSLTGITATCAADPVFSTYDRVGWVEIVGVEGNAHNTARLNNVSADAYRGDFIKLGITTGSRSDTFQIPTNGVAQYHAGVILDNPTTSTGTNFVWDESDAPGAGYVTVTSSSHGFEDNDIVTITSVSPSAFNVTNVRITKINSNSFKYPMRSNPGTYVSGGTVTGQPEKIPVTSTAALVANIDTDSLRGKWCWIDSSTGTVRFGNDGTNSTGGWLPPSGRTVLMPNLFLQNCTSAAKTVNSHNSSLNSRYLVNTTNAGVLNMTCVSTNWRMNVISTAKSSTITDSFFCDQLGYTTVSNTILLTRVCVSTPVAATNTVLTVSNNLGGLTAVDCVFSAGEWTSGKINFNTNTAYNCSFTRCRFVASGQRVTASLNVSTSIGTGFVYDQCVFGGSGVFTSQNANIRAYHSTFYDCTGGTTQPSNAISAFNFTNRADDVIVNGFDTGGISHVGPRNPILTTNTASGNIKFYNAGTYDNPLIFGGAYVTKVGWTRSSATITVTSTAHGLRTNDVVYIYQSDSVGAITLASKTITVLTANTFSFTGIVGGNLSGNLSYYPTGSITLINIGSGCTNVRVQNVHAKYNSGAPIVNNNATDSLTIRNFSSETNVASLTSSRSANNFTGNSLMEVPYTSLSNTAATYGTHFLDSYIRPPALSPFTGVSWTRSSSTITVTATAHGLTTTDRVFFYNSSDPTATLSGHINNMTVLDADTFTYTGAASGAASGTISFRREDSRLFIPGNETSSLTTSQVTFPSGTASFTGAGTITAPTIGDTTLWETPDFIIGYDSFPQIPIFMGTGTLTNYDITYAIDTGSGYSSFKNLHYSRTGAGGSSSSTTVTMTSTTGVNAGDYVFGTGIADGATVSSITNSTDIVVSIANTATVSGTLTFNHLPAEGTIPSTGFKLKVKVVTTVTNSTVIAYLWIPLSSTTTSRNRLYSQADQYTLTLTGLQTGSDISIRTAGVVGANLVNVNANAGSTYAYTYYYSAGASVDFDVYKYGYKNVPVRSYSLGAASTSYPITQPIDTEAE